jgi:hypothetical protein
MSEDIDTLTAAAAAELTVRPRGDRWTHRPARAARGTNAGEVLPSIG